MFQEKDGENVRFSDSFLCGVSLSFEAHRHDVELVHLNLLTRKWKHLPCKGAAGRLTSQAAKLNLFESHLILICFNEINGMC